MGAGILPLVFEALVAVPPVPSLVELSNTSGVVSGVLASLLLGFRALSVRPHVSLLVNTHGLHPPSDLVKRVGKPDKIVLVILPRIGEVDERHVVP